MSKTSVIRVARRPGTVSSGRLTFLGRTMACALGKGGISAAKREGDGATPRGRFPLRKIWLRPNTDLSRLKPRLPTRLIRPDDGWCDEPRHRRYNRAIRLPFTASHEKMWRADTLYDIVIEIGWNDFPAIRGRGSAIFMHLARPGYTPTEGCVALRRADMRWLVRRMTARTMIDIR